MVPPTTTTHTLPTTTEQKYDPKYFDVKYDAKDGFRATEIKILSCARPHMR